MASSQEEVMKFWNNRKTNRWLCNRSLSPSEDKSGNDTRQEKDQQNSPASPTYDSDADPEFVPDTESESEEEPKRNIPKQKQEMENEPPLICAGEGESAEPSRHAASKKYKRQTDMCYFCETDVQNFVRHLRRNHLCETKVQEIFSHQKNSVERRKLLAILKKKGNFIKNSEECVKPVKKARSPSASFLPCGNCLGFYRSKFLYRHKKKCLEGQSAKNAQSEAQNLLVKNKRIDQRLKVEVFPRMRADKISLEAKNDYLICAYGARYLKTHREKHFINVTSRKMRELSRILLELKKLEPTIHNLFDALKPKHYDQLVEATKSVANYDTVNDTFDSPTFAMNISTALKQCCDIAIHMVIKNEPSVETATYEASLKTMINLLQSNWRFDVSGRAGNDLNLKKFNKVTIVPLATDLRLLKNYLLLKAGEAVNRLARNAADANAYTTLLETVYCRVILLNRKRPGELQRMFLRTYESSEIKSGAYEEFEEVITEAEKLLIKNLKRVVIRGKRGRGVPVLFSHDIQLHVKELLKVRNNFVPKENPYFFGKPRLTGPIQGYKVIAKYAHACGAKNPQAITCTRLRKHLATLSQLFSLNENEIEQLSNFMGHTPGVHKDAYRLPDDLYQTAKISKLLILMEKGQAGENKGKGLEELTVDLEEDLLEENGCDDEDGEDMGKEEEDQEEREIKEMLSNKTVVSEQKGKKTELPVAVNKKKRILTPWTSEQKEAVTFFFNKNIKMKKAPKRKDCEEIKSLYPELLANKDWLKIKVFIQNAYSKRSK
ncbi:unnamed protein product [Acanthoscelides obtectus]|uniref:Uncharacterized protein n=2 Tax=Acanthoscelides obtectus TaxID=200917 RepID=A0A9P0K3N6_ACAOB|nr:unnamed protein product [Acanthoscelides obtectus]CAK1629702.1 hypothetical protein AOBTE_LOCUS5905 [Acanthoscelides obtectus]